MDVEEREDKRQERRVVWNTKAGPERWEQYRARIEQAKMEFEAAMTTEEDINKRYNKWEKILER